MNTAHDLAALYTRSGLPCEIDRGDSGLVVYASRREHVERITKDLARAIRERDPRATTTRPLEDKDEHEATRWWAAVEFDWRKF